MKETSRKLFYIFRNCYKIWNELSGWKGSVTYGLGADLSLSQCLSVTTGIWTLTHKSDLRVEISGSIVWYDALAPRPEVLLSWYSVCACAVYLGQKLLPYSWEEISRHCSLHLWSHMTNHRQSQLRRQFAHSQFSAMATIIWKSHKIEYNCA